MNKLKILALSVSLLTGAETAHALTPWTNGVPDITIYLSGSVAVTGAYTATVVNNLAATGTVDEFDDINPNTLSVGSNWTVHYFTGASTLGSGLAGKKILLVRRTAGGAGYGVIPLIGDIRVEHMNVLNTKANQWTSFTPPTGVTGAWKMNISSTNAATMLTKVIPDAGIIAVDPNILLKPGTQNYPDQQPQLTTGLVEPGWPTNIKSIITSGPGSFVIKPTAGLTYGVAVTLDLYKVLQAAQKRSGYLPSSVTIGSYTEASMPSLSSRVIGSIIAGKVGAWDQVKIFDTASSTAMSLVDVCAADCASLNITPPYQEATTGNNFTPVALGLRNNGAATSLMAYSVFLDYPGTQSAFAPATLTANNAVAEDASLPIVKHPVIISDTGTLLQDWQNGTNTLGFNNVVVGSSFATRWGIAINTADKNTSVTTAGTGGSPWRYIKVDGYAPTIDNVASGNYNYWSEGSLLWRTTKAGDTSWGVKTQFLTQLAAGLASPTNAGSAKVTQAWGHTGSFATTAAGVYTYTPILNYNAPVVPYTHQNGALVNGEIAPVAVPGSGLKTSLSVLLR